MPNSRDRSKLELVVMILGGVGLIGLVVMPLLKVLFHGEIGWVSMVVLAVFITILGWIELVAGFTGDKWKESVVAVFIWASASTVATTSTAPPILRNARDAERQSLRAITPLIDPPIHLRTLLPA